VTCREFADFIGDYLAGELPAPVQTGFDRHLEVCPNCRRYLRSYEETVTLGQRAFEDENAMLPQDVPEELVSAILAASRR
jgi:anti-sigma factor RsiW